MKSREQNDLLGSLLALFVLIEILCLIDWLLSKRTPRSISFVQRNIGVPLVLEHRLISVCV